MKTNTRTYPGGVAFSALLEVSHANSDGRAPSAEAVKILAEYFEQWVAEDGHRRFDEVLGFVGGKGNSPFLEKMRERCGHLFISHLIAVLHAGGFTVADAAELASVAINRSTDLRFRKQCKQFDLNPPTTRRMRDGRQIEHLPPKSCRRIFDDRGGEKWAHLAGYFGEDGELRRTHARLDLTDQDTLNFIADLGFCRSLPFRSVAELRPVIPPDGLPPGIAKAFRTK